MNEENEARDRAREAVGLDAFLDTMVSLTGLDRESAFESCCSPNSKVHYPAKYAPAIWKAALGAGYDAGYERGKAENAELLAKAKEVLATQYKSDHSPGIALGRLKAAIEKAEGAK